MHGIWFLEEGCCQRVFDLIQELIEQQQEPAPAADDDEEQEKGLGGLAKLLSKAKMKNSSSGASPDGKTSSNGDNDKHQG